MKLVYNYNFNTGEFSGSTEADMLPGREHLVEDESSYSLPAFATFVPPPSVGVYETTVWNGTGWDVVSDYTKITVYDKHTGETVFPGTIIRDANRQVIHPPALGSTLNERFSLTPTTPSAEYLAEQEKAAYEQYKTDLFNEKYRRMIEGIVFDGVRYQTSQYDMLKINVLSGFAVKALEEGSQPGDYRWFDPDNDFEWIAMDNTFHKMDAQTFLDFSKAVAVRETKYTMAVRHIKDTSPRPTNYTDDQYWPVE